LFALNNCVKACFHRHRIPLAEQSKNKTGLTRFTG
jgi:hypothetical protein